MVEDAERLGPVGAFAEARVGRRHLVHAGDEAWHHFLDGLEAPRRLRLADDVGPGTAEIARVPSREDGADRSADEVRDSVIDRGHDLRLDLAAVVGQLEAVPRGRRVRVNGHGGRPRDRGGRQAAAGRREGRGGGG